MNNYPTRNGLPVSPLELNLSESVLSDRRKNKNNHHYCWTMREMGRLLVTQTLRDLESYQEIIPKDTHNQIHTIYDPPEIDLASVFERVAEAYYSGEQLRYGSANNYQIRSMSENRMDAIKLEYELFDLSNPIIDLGAAS